MGLEYHSAGMYQRRPRIDILTFAGTLKKEEMLEPQVVEYTYTGDETAGINPDTHLDNVLSWEIEKSNNPEREIKILEVDGNYIKFHIHLLSEAGWSPIINEDGSFKDEMNLRVLLWAHMGDKIADAIAEQEAKYISSPTSMVYHTEDCAYAKKIKEKTNDIYIKKKPCSRCL